MHSLDADVERVNNPWNATATVSSGQDADMIISPSPPPPSSTDPIRSQSQMQGTDTPDPRIASLKAIFPDFDDTVIHSVLESTNYDHDRALDVLLGMNDPSFVPPAPPPSLEPPNQFFQSAPSSDAQRISQEALDEEFARRLALEEQQGAAQPWPPQNPQNPTMYQAYQPPQGVRGGFGSSSQDRPQGQGQTNYSMAEFQDGFNRIAESGKKTFSSIVSKVKAKMQEFDQGQGWSGSSPQSGSTQYHPSYAPGQQQNLAQGAYAQPYHSTQSYPSTQPLTNSTCHRTSTFRTSPPRSGVLRPAAAETTQTSATSQHPSYYDPNTRGYDLYGEDEEIQIVDNTTPSAPAATTTPSIATAPKPATPLHADSLASPATSSPPPSFVTSPPPSYASPSPVSTISPRPSLSTTPPARSLTGTPTAGGGRSTTPGAPGGVDFSKLGLLPKRQISLVRPQSPPVSGAGVDAPRMDTAHSASTTASSTDREEERESEFVENPFEDPR